MLFLRKTRRLIRGTLWQSIGVTAVLVAGGLLLTTTVVIARILLSTGSVPAKRAAEIRLANHPQVSGMISLKHFRKWSAESDLNLAAFSGQGMIVETPASVERLNVLVVTGPLLEILGNSPEVGTVGPGVLLAHNFWRTRYSGISVPDVLSDTLRIDGQVFPIRGIMSADFAFPLLPSGRIHQQPSIWLLLAENSRGYLPTTVGVVASLESDTSATLTERLKAILTDDATFLAVPLNEDRRRVAAPYLAIWNGIATVLLVAVAVLIARLVQLHMVARRTERKLLAVLGAPPWRLRLEPLSGAWVIGIIAAVLSVLGSEVALQIAFAGAPFHLPPEMLSASLARTYGMLAFCSVYGVLILVSILVAWRYPLVHGASGSDSRSSHVAAVLGAAPTMIAVYLIGSALAAIGTLTYAASASERLGWSDVYFATLWPSEDHGTLPQASSISRSVESLLIGLRRANVTHAAAATAVPFQSGRFDKLDIDGSGRFEFEAQYVEVTDDYFELLGVPIVEKMADRLTGCASSNPAILDRRQAYLLKPQRGLLGSSFRLRRDRSDITVCGLVEGDVPSTSPLALPGQLFRLLSGSELPLRVLIRTDHFSKSITSILRAEAKAHMPGFIATEFMNLAELGRRSTAPLALTAATATVAAGGALVTSVITLFAIFHTIPYQRKSSIALRTLLGASPSRAVWQALTPHVQWQLIAITVAVASCAITGDQLSLYLTGDLKGRPVLSAFVAGIGVFGLLSLSFALASRRAAREPFGVLNAGRDVS